MPIEDFVLDKFRLGNFEFRPSLPPLSNRQSFQGFKATKREKLAPSFQALIFNTNLECRFDDMAS